MEIYTRDQSIGERTGKEKIFVRSQERLDRKGRNQGIDYR